jgi:hypothetical protein
MDDSKFASIFPRGRPSVVGNEIPEYCCLELLSRTKRGDVQMEDKKMERNRAAEDEKYHTSLANRAQEDKQRRERQTTEAHVKLLRSKAPV